MSMRFKEVLLSVIICCVFVLLFSGCSDYKTLEAPSGLETDGTLLRWEKVEGAESYIVDIDGKEYECNDNELDLFLLTDKYKSYQIKVRAYGDFETVLDSDWSEILIYTISSPVEYLQYRITDAEEVEVRAIKKDSLVGKIIIPDTIEGKPVTKVYGDSFEGAEGITGVIVPDTVTTIGKNAFQYCTNLKKVKLPEYLEEIEVNAFMGCKNLEECVIPRNVSTIGMYAFYDCVALKKINIPRYLQTINQLAFINCCSIENLYVDENNAVYKSSEGYLVSKDGKELLRCFFAADDIPDTITTIGENAFSGNLPITKITLPDSITTIKDNAFTDCTVLKEIILNDGLEKIGKEAFSKCGLTSIKIPRTVLNIGESFIIGCDELTSITVDEENTVYESEGNCLIEKSTATLIAGCKESIIPNSVSIIGEKAFLQCSISYLQLPSSIKRIDSKAFADCVFLKNIDVENGLQTIGPYAFSGCENLQEFKVPFTVTEISIGAFKDCAQAAITLPSTVQTIGGNAIQGTAYSDIDSFRDLPDGWAKRKPYVIWGTANDDDYGALDYACFVTSCKFSFDTNDYYVDSFTYSCEEGKETFFNITDTLRAPTRKGYVFKGWSTDASGTNIVYRPYKIGTSETLYTLKWDEWRIIDDYTVLYSVWEKL